MKCAFFVEELNLFFAPSGFVWCEIHRLNIYALPDRERLFRTNEGHENGEKFGHADVEPNATNMHVVFLMCDINLSVTNIFLYAISNSYYL
jgi:hypothetical protein